MELQLVSKEVAILAKELGFNEICHSILIGDLNNKESVRKISMVGMRNEEKNLASLIATVPEQELLAKWLRDIYSIILYISPHTNSRREKFFGCTICYEGFKDEELTEWKEEDFYNTYERSLEFGLKEALEYLQSIQTNSK